MGWRSEGEGKGEVFEIEVVGDGVWFGISRKKDVLGLEGGEVGVGDKCLTESRGG